MATGKDVGRVDSQPNQEFLNGRRESIHCRSMKVVIAGASLASFAFCGDLRSPPMLNGCMEYFRFRFHDQSGKESI